MPNLLKKRKLKRPERPVFSLSKQIDNPASPDIVHLDDAVSKEDLTTTADETTSEKKPQQTMNEQTEMTYNGDDYLENIDGVSLSIIEDSDKDVSHETERKEIPMDDYSKYKIDTTINIPVDNTTEDNVDTTRNGEEPRSESKTPPPPNEEIDLEAIIANLQSVLPENHETQTTNQNVTPSPAEDIEIDLRVDAPDMNSEDTDASKTEGDKDNYEQTKDIESATELTALIDSIVCDLDDFVKNSLGSEKVEDKGTIQEPQYMDAYDGAYVPDEYEYMVNEQPHHIYATVNKTRKSGSTPDLYHIKRNVYSDHPDDYRYHSLRYPKTPGFSAVTPDKKSVSFNDVVLEVRSPRYRSSDFSLDTNSTLEKKVPLSSPYSRDTDPLLQHDERYADERAAFISTTSITSLRGDDTKRKGGAYDSVTSLSDDAFSMPSEDELYTSGNETETEDELSKGPKVEPFRPKKIKSLIKSRTAFLVLTWFTMGIVAILPSNSLRTPVLSFTTIWTPAPEFMLSKGLGFFLGIFIGAMTGGYLPNCLEITIAFALFLLSGCLAVRPWCVDVLLMSAAHLVEGTGRGLATIASHLYLYRLWRNDRVFLILHCLFIAFAAGASIVPPLSFIISVNAKHLVKNLHTPLLEQWMFSTNGHHVNHSITEVPPTEDYDYVYYAAISTISPNYKDEETKQHVVLTMLQVGFAVLPLILAFIFTAFALYTCCSRCRNSIQKYRHKRKAEKAAKLKEKLSNSMNTVNVFPNLNGNPGKTDVKTENESKNGIKTSNGAVNNGKKSTDEKKNEEAEKTNDVTPSSDKDEQKQSKGENNNDTPSDHVTHIAKSKSKKLAFKLPKEKGAKIKKNPKKKNTWLLNNQRCSVGALLYLYVFFTLAVALEFIFAYFLYFYAIDELDFAPFQAILLLTLYLICLAFSRMLAMPLSHLFPPNAFVIGCLAMGLMSTIVFIVYGDNFETITWLFLAIIGLCIGPLLPGGLTWANIYLNLNAKSLGLAYCLMALGMILFNSLAAALLQLVDCRAVLWLIVALFAFSFILFLPTMPSIKATKVLRLTPKSKADNVIPDAKRTYV